MIQKKKILLRIGSLRHGGAEKVLATFLKNLPRDKYEIDLLLNLYSGKYLQDIPEWINIFHINKGEMITTNRPQDIPRKAFRVIYQDLLKRFPKLLYSIVLKNKKYDIEFAGIHGFRDEILNSPNKSSKKIVWIHSDLRNAQLGKYSDEEIRKFFKFEKILVISENIKRNFENLAKNNDERNRIVHIYNPLDTEEILRNSHQPSIINHQPTFLSVGTIYPAKGFDRLLRVHKKLLEEGFHHKIQIVGDGYDFENIKALRKELAVEQTVELVGFTDNPYPCFY